MLEIESTKSTRHPKAPMIASVSVSSFFFFFFLSSIFILVYFKQSGRYIVLVKEAAV